MALAKERQANRRMASVRLNRTDGKVLKVDLIGASEVENLAKPSISEPS